MVSKVAPLIAVIKVVILSERSESKDLRFV